MKALILAPRFPWPAYTGERLRATIWISALSRNAEVTLVAPEGRVPSEVSALRFHPANRSLTRGMRRTNDVLLGDLPVQCLLAAPFDWAGAIGRAVREDGPFDVTVVLLSRLHPWVHALLQGRTILDAVDSLRRNARERQRAATALTRWLWRIEERRMASLEARAARFYDEIVVVSDGEREDFVPAVAVTTGINTSPLGPSRRTFDFGFWGRLPYFANADAVRWLLDEIWPAIRSKHPAATLAVGGAEAPRWLQRAVANQPGVTLVSPVQDIASFARSIRVALMPIRYGSGESIKTLEAAEAGCAIVGTPLALRGLTSLVPHARIETSGPDLAAAAVELLDETRRAPLATRLREAVETHYARSATLERFWTIAAGDAA
jgi:glycosyltransferase involved in cell wall biosynthesis